MSPSGAGVRRRGWGLHLAVSLGYTILHGTVRYAGGGRRGWAEAMVERGGDSSGH